MSTIGRDHFLVGNVELDSDFSEIEITRERGSGGPSLFLLTNAYVPDALDVIEIGIGSSFLQ